MELNFLTFGYLFLRLAPFILVCFFSLASLFNQDFKGVVYLLGVLGACFTTTMVGKLPVISEIVRPTDMDPGICNMVTIGNVDNISSLPLGQTVISFTFTYILYAIIKNEIVSDNIFTILFFSILTFFDLIWNINNSCYQISQMIISMLTGAGIGILWASVIASTKSTNLKYFVGKNNNEVCSKPSSNTFRCNVYKNGKMIAKNISG